MNRLRSHARPAFTLLEAVMVILVLALAVPPTVAFLDQSASARADAVNTTRATTLAQCVMENVLADASSTAPGLGYAAFADMTTYRDTPTTGLRDRISPMTGLFTGMGMSYTVGASAPVASTGTTSGVVDQDIFRVVTVTVTFESAQQATPLSIALSALVTEL